MKYIASCSFGKDSIATILLALEHNEPLDAVVWSEVMFSNAENISGEEPEHVEWIYSTAIPKLRALGVNVDVVRSEKDYLYWFYHEIKSGKHSGKLTAFPVGGMCVINKSLKIAPIRKYYSRQGLTNDVTQYIGIAIDEPERLERMHKHNNRISLLEKYGYTEAMALAKCKEYGLLSPVYQSDTRGGAGSVRTSHTDGLRDSRRSIQNYGSV